MSEKHVINDNPMMGKSYELNMEEETEMKRLIDLSPMLAFRFLNHKFNHNGFCIAIDLLPKEGNAKVRRC